MNDAQSTLGDLDVTQVQAAPRTGSPRADGAPEPVRSLRFAAFDFDLRREQLSRAGVVIALRPKPTALLIYFLDHAQRVLEKDELLQSVWAGTVVTDDSLVQCVGELRAKLGSDGAALIKTVPRRGYLFDADVVRSSVASMVSAPVPLEEPEATASTEAKNEPKARRPLHALLVTAAGVVLALGAVGGAAFYTHIGAPHFRIDEEVSRRLSLTLMPFRDLGDRPAPLRLREGMVDELAAQLAAGHMTAYPPASVFSRATPMPPFTLRGTMSRRGKGVVVDVQMTANPGGEVVWADHYDYADADDPQINFDVALRAIYSLRLRIFEMHKVRTSAPGHHFDPADLTMAGWEDINRRKTAEDVRRGRQRFEQALAADPDSVIALNGLGAALMSERFGNSGNAPMRDVALSEQVAARAVELSPNDSVSLINWANVLLFRGQPELAEPVYARAVERMPSNANAYLRHATALMLVGRADEMQSRIDSALRYGYKDQRIMAAAFYASAEAAFAKGDEDAAYEFARRSLVERPTFGPACAMLAAIDALHDRPADARRNMREHLRLMPSSTVTRFVTGNPTKDARYRLRRDHMVEGLRAAGLPEG
ncbi:MAG: DNA-binding winged helix-turn-helix protein [Variovorax sp.]|nr:DNA-binding winged helix-turn-helix protein [Variovorax sp.]